MSRQFRFLLAVITLLTGANCGQRALGQAYWAYYPGTTVYPAAYPVVSPTMVYRPTVYPATVVAPSYPVGVSYYPGTLAVPAVSYRPVVAYRPLVPSILATQAVPTVVQMPVATTVALPAPTVVQMPTTVVSPSVAAPCDCGAPSATAPAVASPPIAMPDTEATSVPTLSSYPPADSGFLTAPTAEGNRANYYSPPAERVEYGWRPSSQLRTIDSMPGSPTDSVPAPLDQTMSLQAPTVSQRPVWGMPEALADSASAQPTPARGQTIVHLTNRTSQAVMFCLRYTPEGDIEQLSPGYWIPAQETSAITLEGRVASRVLDDGRSKFDIHVEGYDSIDGRQLSLRPMWDRSTQRDQRGRLQLYISVKQLAGAAGTGE